MHDRITLALALCLGLAGGYLYRGAAADAPPQQQQQPSRPDARPPLSPPTPARKAVAKLLIVTQPKCGPCDRLKHDHPRGFGLPHEWVQNSQEVARRWRVEGTPTLILLDAAGDEIDRQLGYADRESLAEWLAGHRGDGEEGGACVLAGRRVFGAPAPLPGRRRPSPPLDLAGHWLLAWEIRHGPEGGCGGNAFHRVTYRLTLDPCGIYRAQTADGEEWWWGAWSQEGRTLKVGAWKGDGPAEEWSVELDEGMGGQTAEWSGQTVTLSREGGDRP